MPYMYKLLGLAAIISTLVAASPVVEHPHLDSRDELLQLEERQDANTDDLEMDAATDPLRDGKSPCLVHTTTDTTISARLHLHLLCPSDRNILCGFHRGLAQRCSPCLCNSSVPRKWGRRSAARPRRARANIQY